MKSSKLKQPKKIIRVTCRRKEVVAQQSDMTIDEALKKYIEHYEAVLSPSTVRGYAGIRRTRFLSYLRKPVSEIKDWQRVINDEMQIASAKTVYNAWALLRRALKTEAGVTIAKDEVRLPQVPVKETPYLLPDEIIPFCNAVKGDAVEIAALLELHGLRRSEAMGLDWKDVDLKRNLIHVRGALVKGKDGRFVRKETNKNRTSTRTVPIMIPQLAQALDAVSQKQGRVVKIGVNTLFNRIKECCVAAGVTVVGNHGLRHSFASLGYHLGVPERQLMALGGWSDYQTMHKIYIRIAQSDISAAQNAITDFFEKPSAC